MRFMVDTAGGKHTVQQLLSLGKVILLWDCSFLESKVECCHRPYHRGPLSRIHGGRGC